MKASAWYMIFTPPQIPWEFFTAGNLSQVFHPSGPPAESSLEALLESKVLREALLLRLHGQLQVNAKKRAYPVPLKRTASKSQAPELGQKFGPKLGKFIGFPSKIHPFFWGGRFLTVSGRVVFLRFGVVNFVYHCHDVYIACT